MPDNISDEVRAEQRDVALAAFDKGFRVYISLEHHIKTGFIPSDALSQGLHTSELYSTFLASEVRSSLAEGLRAHKKSKFFQEDSKG